MRIRSLVGQRVREYRQRAGLTQRELADRLGRQEVTISSIERGRNFPSEDTLVGLSEVLELPLHAFFEVTDLKSRDTKREEAVGKVLAIVRTLPERDLELALRQLEAFAPEKSR
ncbi:MAG: helix-turn-helix transcriptional regulator [Alphaproteobacteria bacterium]|nr:helix-turn-helix transcriptional regulator [Alphaproteobacteria bacterium]